MLLNPVCPPFHFQHLLHISKKFDKKSLESSVTRDLNAEMLAGKLTRVGRDARSRRRLRRRFHHRIRELPDMMSASEGGHGKVDVVREVA